MIAGRSEAESRARRATSTAAARRARGRGRRRVARGRAAPGAARPAAPRPSRRRRPLDALAQRRAGGAGRYCATIECTTTVALPSARAASRASSHGSASARSTATGCARATSSARSSSAIRSVWSAQTAARSVSRSASDAGSSGWRSQPARDATATEAGCGGTLVDVAQAHGRAGRTEREARRLVAVAVPVEVQPGAGADLEHAQRQAGRPRDGEKAGEQRGGAARLVRLQRGVEQRVELGGAVVEQGPQVRPGLLRGPGAARGLIPARERGRRSGQREPVRRRHQPQRQRVALALGRPRAQQRPAGPPASTSAARRSSRPT